MRWFNKEHPKELWEEVIDLPIDDLEVASGYATSANPPLVATRKLAAKLADR
jgi:hypothetical protein